MLVQDSEQGKEEGTAAEGYLEDSEQINEEEAKKWNSYQKILDVVVLVLVKVDETYSMHRRSTIYLINVKAVEPEMVDELEFHSLNFLL